MDQVQEGNITTSSCIEQSSARANCTYQVTQERGYSVTRLTSAQFGMVAGLPVGAYAPIGRVAFPGKNMKAIKPEGKLIPFPEPRKPQAGRPDELQEMIQIWLELARHGA